MKAIASYHDLVRKDALAFLPEKLGRVLDFGGGIGATAAALRDGGRANHVVLFDQVAANALPQIDAAEPLDFEDGAAVRARTAAHGPFDTILALDILEHLRDPWAVVASLEPALAPGGRMLVSVPNLRFYKVMLDLLLRDRFEYVDAGVLDRTHLRWFTQRSVVALATGPGLTCEAVRSNPLSRTQKLFNALTLGLFGRFLAAQWMVMVRKPG